MMSRKRFGLAFVLLLTGAAFLQAQYTTLHEFAPSNGDGGGAFGALLKKGNALYGMTPWGGGPMNAGVIFKINANGTGYNVLYAFQDAGDGANPYGSLIFKGGKFYGMTENGGTYDGGVIFQVNLNGSGYKVLHHFGSGETDGAKPTGSLVFFGGQFYGVTARGGTDDNGTVFRISPKGTGFAVLHSFTSTGTDGFYPHGALKAMAKKLYGTTSCGGANGLGTVFRIDITGANYVQLHSFTDAETGGTNPNMGALVAKGQTLFGMTAQDYHALPTGLGGILYKINADGTGFAVLHAFAGGDADGYGPCGGLRISGTQLYGMTCYGGNNGSGTIFRIGVNGTGFAVLHSFIESSTGSSNGIFPKSDLTISGKLAYGMTDYGGVEDYGVIFSFKLK